MVRPLRIEFEDTFHRIGSRGNLRDRIFFDEEVGVTHLRLLTSFL